MTKVVLLKMASPRPMARRSMPRDLTSGFVGSHAAKMVKAALSKPGFSGSFKPTKNAGATVS